MTWTRDGVGAILVVLTAALAFRLIIAYSFPGTGLSFDLASFQGWANDLATNGLHGFYERPGFHDYTPGYLYVLYLVGLIANATGIALDQLIKLPAILADVAIGWLVWSMALELGAKRRVALVAAAIVVANPVSWFDSVTWGQVDSFGVVFLLLGVRDLWRDRPERAAVWTVIAALIKPQLGILIPVVAVVTIRRALWPPRPAEDPAEAPVDVPAEAPSEASGDVLVAAEVTVADPEPAAGLIGRLRAWERQTDRPIRIITTGLVALVTTFILCAPFGLSVIELRDGGVRSGLIEQIFKTAGGYPYVSVNAYNPWALAELAGSGIAKDGRWICDALIANPVEGGPVCDTAFQIGPIPALFVGTALLVTAFVVICAMVARRPDRLTILVGVTLLAVAFFVLPTRVHERYLFPFFALGAILAAISLRWLVAYIILSAATFLNMYVVLTTLYPGNPAITDWLGIGEWIRSSMGVRIIAFANVAAAMWAFLQIRPAAIGNLEAELEGWDDEFDALDAADDDVRELGRAAPGTEGPAGAVLAGSMSQLPRYAWDPNEPRRPHDAPSGVPPDGVSPGGPVEPAMPTWSDRPSFAEVGLIGWLKARLNERPLRADRSRALHGEPPGRLDRLDLWFLVVIVVATLGLRTFRLAEPYQMHFDEVYHARTATEFLQSWRYGLSHDIYEWTHPHLAKYAMAGGIVAWGDDRVSATSNLGVPVRDALVEVRRDDEVVPDGRAGDHVHVVTGSELRTYDLESRELVYAAPVPDAVALTIDPAGERLLIGTTGGQILTFDLFSLDGVRSLAASADVTPPEAFGRVDGTIRQLHATDDGQTLFVATDDDRLITLDAVSAEELGTTNLAGIAAFAPVGDGPALTMGAGAVEDPAAVARALADIIGGDAATYEARLRSTAESTAESTIIAGIDSAEMQADIQAGIADNRLAGLTIEDVPRVALATADGVTFVSPMGGIVVSTTEVDGGAFGLDLITNVDDPKLYVSTGGKADGAPGEVAVIAVGGDVAKNGPVLQRTIPLPVQGSRVAYDEATQMVHVLGPAPGGDGWTIYVIEPHANAVFADARLPFEPSALGIDVAKPYPTDDRQQILAFAADGGVASVEIGKHAFAWRLPGVIAGALMAGLLYLLGRILFRRREVAVLAGLFGLVDGMFFVQSRIGMNDAYVGLGIIAAYTLFAAIWMGAWRWRGAFWVAMPVIGVFLGLALASKWVALYALGALGILVLIRSALGRLVLIASLIVLTGVLGHLALVVPAGGGLGNLPFVAIMVGLTSIAAVVNVLHPIAWSDDEMRFAVGAPAALGAIVALGAIALGQAGRQLIQIGAPSAAASPAPSAAPVIDAPAAAAGLAVTPLHVAMALVVLSLVVYLAFVLAGRAGFGPLASPPDPSDPAALLPAAAPPPREAWLRPGALLGLPIAWMLVCMLVIPFGLYVASYIPWAFVEGHRITASWPPGHEGQTLIDLTRQMYDYHNNLAAGHAASSPWWAWPFNLKPVWFYQEGFAGSTTAAVYDAGNLVVWWLGVPALAFVAWQAYARRSLGLALLAIAFACQWVSWARIDRAAFQYHYYTSLPFVILALAYFVAEIWHGTSRRIWLLARVSAAFAVLGPGLLWLFDRPLCGLVGVSRAVPNSQACPPLIPEFVLTAQTLALGAVVFISILVFLRLLVSLNPSRSDGHSVGQLLPLGITAAVALVGLLLVRLLPQTPIVTLTTIPVEPVVVVIALLPLSFLALFVATARDARRFVVGLLTAVVAWFLIWYPNIAALPLPSVIANAYQGFLPTYLYAFQFPSNRETVVTGTKLIDPVAAILAVAMTLLCVVLAYSAWVWRIALAERAADDAAASAALAPEGPSG